MMESAKARLGDYWRRFTADSGTSPRWIEDNWKFLTFAFWVGICAYYLVLRWNSIHWFALGDTDDNMRYLQVRDWLAGQGWYDLRQYRLDPPGGANIHWSRLVDLPLAGLMLFFRAFMEQGQADRLACGIAPLLPLFPLMLSLGFIVRRLAPGPAWIAAVLLPLAAAMGLGMFLPMRVDHHGWQLALAAATMAGIVDRDWLRGGIVAGLSSALSVAIGMEMIAYLACGGGVIALRWVFKDGAARRMVPYAASLGGGTAILYLLFASYANRQPVCDALSPIWVGIFSAASGLLLLLAMLPLRTWWQRLIAGAVAGALLGAFVLLNWPQCLSAYQIPPELQRLWLANIREAKPITAQARNAALPMLALPVIGLTGALVGCWSARRDGERLWAWGTVALMILFALALLCWQIRAGPAAQLLAIPGVAWAAWAAAQAILKGGWVRKLVGLVAVLLVALVVGAYQLYPQVNAAYSWAIGEKAGKPPGKATLARREAIRKASGRCRALPALQRLDRLPPALIFTLVDLGPRLIAMTHHSAIAGPYHRNARAILDIHHAMDGQPAEMLAIAARHHAAYFLMCPNFPEGTVYHARSPRGFYAQMMRGQVPAWLRPVDLKAGYALPFTLYRIDYAAAAASAPPGEKAAQ
jgi:hypothetical protein